MPEFVIKSNRQGKINILVEDLPSQVAHLYFQKAYEDNGEKLTFYPLAVNSLAFVKDEDLIVAGRQNHPLFETTLSHLGVDKDAPSRTRRRRRRTYHKSHTVCRHSQRLHRFCRRRALAYTVLIPGQPTHPGGFDNRNRKLPVAV